MHGSGGQHGLVCEDRLDLAHRISRVMFGVCVVFTVVILLLLGLVTGYLLSIGIGSLSWDFFTKLPTGDPANPGGMNHAIWGTIILIAIASTTVRGAKASDYNDPPTFSTEMGRSASDADMIKARIRLAVGGPWN